MDLNKLALFCLLCIFSSGAAGQQFDIYISDAGNFQSPPWQILKYDQNGENGEVFISENLDWPQDIVFLEGDGSVLISNLNSGLINRHNAITGALIGVFAVVPNGPTRMKIGPDGLLYVLSWNNNAPVRRYRLDGTPLGDFTNAGVNQAIGLDWDTSGNLYVSSYNGAFVRRFDTNGNDLGFFINTDLAGPTNIWFDDTGELLVIDFDGGNVKRFDSDGNFLEDFILGMLMGEGIDFYPNGDILIGNGGQSNVQRFDTDGQFVETVIAAGAGGLLKPNAVVIKPRGSDFKINAGLNDAWFNPLTPGQGFFITVFPDIEKVFLAWFTYDTERPDLSIIANLGEPGHRWLTALGDYSGDSTLLNIELSSGGIFDSATPQVLQGPYGTISITWSGCDNAILSYNIPLAGVEGIIPITRIAPDNIARCEELDAATQ